MSQRKGPTHQHNVIPTRPDDRGGLNAALTVELGKVAIDFAYPVRWVYMLPHEAREFARVLNAMADKADGKTR